MVALPGFTPVMVMWLLEVLYVTFATEELLVVTFKEVPLWSMPTIFFSPISRYWSLMSYSVTFFSLSSSSGALPGFLLEGFAYPLPVSM